MAKPGPNFTEHGSIEPYRGPGGRSSQEIQSKIMDWAAQGQFPEEWCVHLGMTPKAFYDRCRLDQELKDCVAFAWTVLLAFHSRKLVVMMDKGHPKTSTMVELLKRRFPTVWAEQDDGKELTPEHFEQVMDGTDSEHVDKLSDDDLDDEIRILQQRLSDRKGS
ncbi:MAG: hypothetical protein AAGI03_09090 [Pseudomonadota bacterium]